MEETRRANAQKSKKKEKHQGSSRRGEEGRGGGEGRGDQKRVGRGKGEAPRRSYDCGGVRHLKEAPEAARVDREGRVGEEKPRVVFALDG